MTCGYLLGAVATAQGYERCRYALFQSRWRFREKLVFNRVKPLNDERGVTVFVNHR